MAATTGAEVTVAMMIVAPTVGISPAVIAAPTVATVKSGIVIVAVISRTTAEIDAETGSARAAP
jgi:Sec-independent protein secretion pathway component TatC